MIIEAVLLADERGEFFDLFTLGVVGESAQIVKFGEQRVERTARFDQVQPEIFRPGEKRREPPRVKFRDDRRFRVRAERKIFRLGFQRVAQRREFFQK